MNGMDCLRLLYVEDDEATREALSRFLKPRVGRLVTAASGEEGLKKFEEYRPNLLIVDLIMPGMSGLEMIGEIRKISKECRIMITSTVNELNTVLEAGDMGIDHYIVKPIDTEDLVKKLEGIAQGIQSREGRTGRVNLGALGNSGLMEDAIRRDFLRLVKTHSGKGPRDVKVLLFGSNVEITAFDAATVLEKTIAANRRNLSLAEQFRRVFYEEIAQMLESCVKEVTGYPVRMTSVQIDGAKRIDKIILTVL